MAKMLVVLCKALRVICTRAKMAKSTSATTVAAGTMLIPDKRGTRLNNAPRISIVRNLIGISRRASREIAITINTARNPHTATISAVSFVAVQDAGAGAKICSKR